ncbi:hypothetical protein RUND412_002475 [Rhizina undulata]
MDIDGDETDYLTEDPTPAPYRPPMHLSRHPNRHAGIPKGASALSLAGSPPTNGRTSPMNNRMSMSHQDHTFDETISILDPRRFTPTLHANLVAEILSLRRELESKSSLIDSLEGDLSAARTEQENATTTAASAQKEARDIKRQLVRAEKDDAIDVVARERDEAVETVAELRKQVERLTKSRRSSEEDMEKLRVMMERDNERFEEQKRALERRAHVAEGRLKAVLDEIAAAQQEQARPPSSPRPNSAGIENDDGAQSDAGSDIASIRTMSIRGSIRGSILGRPTSLSMGDDEAERLGYRMSQLGGNGLSLADELNFDEDEEEEEEEEDDDVRSGSEAEGSTADRDYEEEGSEADTERRKEVLTEYAEMGTQVEEDDISDSENPQFLNGLLDEKLSELKRTYRELDQKNVELEHAYAELDSVNERVADLEHMIERMESEAEAETEAANQREKIYAEMEEAYSEKERVYREKEKAFMARERAYLEHERAFADKEKRYAEITRLYADKDFSYSERDRRYSERDKEYSELDLVYSQKDKDYSELEINYSDKDRTYTDKDRIYSEKDRTYADKDRSYADKDNFYADRDRSYSEKDRSYADKDRVYFEKDRSYAAKDNAYIEKVNEIAEKEAIYTEKDRIYAKKDKAYLEKEKSYAEKEREIAVQEKILADKEEEHLEHTRLYESRVLEMEERWSELEDRRKLLEHLEKELEERSNNLDEREEHLAAREQAVEAALEEALAAIPIREHEDSSDDDSVIVKVGEQEYSDGYEANEGRKRVSISLPIQMAPPAVVLVSTETQTVEERPATPPVPKIFVDTDVQTIPPPTKVFTSVDVQTIPERPSTPPPPKIFIDMDVQTIPERPPTPPPPKIYASVDCQTVVDYPTPPPPEIYASVDCQTVVDYPTPPPPKIYASVDIQTVVDYPTPPPPKIYASMDIQTEVERPPTPPPPKVLVSVNVQTIPERPPTPPPQKVYVSVEIQTEAECPPIPPLVPKAVYVSADTQTMCERPPTPPKSPPPPLEKIMMNSISIQTDPTPIRPPPLAHIIPTIAVIPPPPTPPLSAPPKPVMRSISVQTKPLPRRRDHSMQTEEIRVHERLLKTAPQLLPSAMKISANSSAAPQTPTDRNSKRNSRRSSKHFTVGERPVTNGMGTFLSDPQSDLEEAAGIDRGFPVLKRQLFDFSQDLAQSSGDEEFHDAEGSVDEYKTALSAPRPRKPKQQHLAQTESPETDWRKSRGLQRTQTVRRPNSMRRNAMVSNGVQTQQNGRPRSPSLTSNRTNEGKVGPPFPVPARYSSRKVSSNFISDYANPESPPYPAPMQKQSSLGPLPQQSRRQKSIRKVQSAAALPSLRSPDSRNRSPPPLSASSGVPDSPEMEMAPPLPTDEVVVSPSFERHKYGATKHKNISSTNTSVTGNTGNTSTIGSSINQQTSVVDAISQTMVGEWMWKYVRRRRSFGVSDSPQNWDGKDDSAGGQRHKRWVWLAPYERAVMWSSRQPTSGTALLGKSGRKRKPSLLQPLGGASGLSIALDKVLTNKVPIQSVLDVKDDTPLPKNTGGAPLFNRSILILTPARALKFTASSKERHYVWLTALSFLSHSEQENDGMLALPPPMPFEYENKKQKSPANVHMANIHPPPPPIPVTKEHPFNPIRDSIRIAKGKTRSSKKTLHLRELDVGAISNDESSVADPPDIPRYPGYSRRRSSTLLPRPGTSHRASGQAFEFGLNPAFGAPMTMNNDFYFNGNSNRNSMGVGGIGIIGNSAFSQSNSAFGGAPSSWEPASMGTVSMQAFVERDPRYDDDYDRSSIHRTRQNRRSSRQESYWSGNGDFYAGPPTFDDEEFFRDDPFRGF